MNKIKTGLIPTTSTGKNSKNMKTKKNYFFKYTSNIN